MSKRVNLPVEVMNQVLSIVMQLPYHQVEQVLGNVRTNIVEYDPEEIVEDERCESVVEEDQEEG